VQVHYPSDGLMGCTFTSPLLRIYLGYYVPNFIRIGLIFWRVAKLKLVFFYLVHNVYVEYIGHMSHVSYMIYQYIIYATHMIVIGTDACLVQVPYMNIILLIYVHTRFLYETYTTETLFHICVMYKFVYVTYTFHI